jgi:hypothetical protein
MHKAKRFLWEGNSFLWVWNDGWMWIVAHLKQHEGFVQHVHLWIGSFWGSTNLKLVIITIFVVWNYATTGSIVYFLMCGIWLSLDIIQLTYTSFITNTKVSMEFGFYRPIEFDSTTQPICIGCDCAFFQMVGISAIIKL